MPGRRLATALGLSIALTGATFALTSGVAGALAGVGWRARSAATGWSWGNLLMVAAWWWALHAPVAVTRWRTRAQPTEDAVRAVAEALGASLVATAGVLVATGAVRVGAIPCMGLGVGALVWAWRRKAVAAEPSGPPEQPGEANGSPYRAVRSAARASKWRFPWRQWARVAAMLGWAIALVGYGP